MCGKRIYLGTLQDIKFDYKNKWYMHKLNTIQENAMHNILFDFKTHRIYLKVVDFINKRKQLVI